MPWREPISERSGLRQDTLYTAEQFCSSLSIDVRFVKVLEQAGFEANLDGRFTPRALWTWFGGNFEEFRRSAGMRPLHLPKSLKGHRRALARYDAALMTIFEFFGCLPFEQALSSAAEVLKPARGNGKP